MPVEESERSFIVLFQSGGAVHTTSLDQARRLVRFGFQRHLLDRRRSDLPVQVADEPTSWGDVRAFELGSPGDLNGTFPWQAWADECYAAVLEAAKSQRQGRLRAAAAYALDHGGMVYKLEKGRGKKKVVTFTAEGLEPRHFEETFLVDAAAELGLDPRYEQEEPQLALAIWGKTCELADLTTPVDETREVCELVTPVDETP